MSELQALVQWIADLLSEYLYTGVFLAALLETIIPPIPTMAVFPTAGFIASQNGLSVAEAVLLGIVRIGRINWFNSNLSYRSKIRTNSIVEIFR